MPGTKTSVWLGEEQFAQWKASRLSLTEIVKRGLAAPDPQEVAATALLAAIREEIAASEERVLGAVRQIAREFREFREELERMAGR